MGLEGEERQPSETRQKARTWARESWVKKSEKKRTRSERSVTAGDPGAVAV